MNSCTGRVAIVTGAGRGIGRATALLLAAEGARVVINDMDADAAYIAVEDVWAVGGEAVANTDDVSDWEGAERLVTSAVTTFGGLDALVNNAGVVRDRMFVNMGPDDWDDVMRVHLRGTFAPTRHAVDFWRSESKAGRIRTARVVNTASPAGLYGNVGQANYSAAKAGLAAFTKALADELHRYGILSNAIAPEALTDMTAAVPGFADSYADMAGPDWENPGDPQNIVALSVWLASPLSTANGRVFNVRAGHISVAEGWRPAAETYQKSGPFSVEDIAATIPGLLTRARPEVDYRGNPKYFGAPSTPINDLSASPVSR